MIRTPGVDRPPGAFDTSCPPGQVRSRPPHRLPRPRKRGIEAICHGLALAAGIEESDPIDPGAARSSLGKTWGSTKAGDHADGSAQPQSAGRENGHGGAVAFCCSRDAGAPRAKFPLASLTRPREEGLPRSVSAMSRIRTWPQVWRASTATRPLAPWCRTGGAILQSRRRHVGNADPGPCHLRCTDRQQFGAPGTASTGDSHLPARLRLQTRS